MENEKTNQGRAQLIDEKELEDVAGGLQPLINKPEGPRVRKAVAYMFRCTGCGNELEGESLNRYEGDPHSCGGHYRFAYFREYEIYE